MEAASACARPALKHVACKAGIANDVRRHINTNTNNNGKNNDNTNNDCSYKVTGLQHVSFAPGAPSIYSSSMTKQGLDRHSQCHHVERFVTRASTRKACGLMSVILFPWSLGLLKRFKVSLQSSKLRVSPLITPIMENHMEKNMDNEMEN